MSETAKKTEKNNDPDYEVFFVPIPSQGADPVEHVGEPSGLQAREFPVAGVVEEEGGRQLTGPCPGPGPAPQDKPGSGRGVPYFQGLKRSRISSSSTNRSWWVPPCRESGERSSTRPRI